MQYWLVMCRLADKRVYTAFIWQSSLQAAIDEAHKRVQERGWEPITRCFARAAKPPAL